MTPNKIADNARKTAEATKYPYKPSNLVKIGLILGACMALAVPPEKTPPTDEKPAIQNPELKFYEELQPGSAPPTELSWEELFLNLETWKNAPLQKLVQGQQWKVESTTEAVIKYTNILPIEFLGGPARIVRIRENQATKTIECIEVIWTDLAMARIGDIEYEIAIEKDERKKKAMLKGLEDQNESFKKACLPAYNELGKKLTSLYGKPTRGKFGGKSNFTVPTLDFKTDKGVTIRLIQENEKRLFAMILPTEVAEKQKTEILKPEAIGLRKKERMDLAKKNVETLENGDVVIKNLPMQDQGKRPICGLATMSMVMEYWGATFPYELGLVKKGSFSAADDYTKNFYGALERAKLQPQKTHPKFRSIIKEIDDGKPLTVNRRSRFNRNDLYAQWRDQAKENKDFVIPVEDRKERKEKWPNDEDPAHQSIIIGYNKDKKVVIVSDSWGDHQRSRRISLEEFEYIARDITTYTPL